jgi:hypothetical protein
VEGPQRPPTQPCHESIRGRRRVRRSGFPRLPLACAMTPGAMVIQALPLASYKDFADHDR